MIECLLWAPDRDTFVATLCAVALPTGGTLASLDEETGALTPGREVLIDEIGPVTKEPATYDAEGNELTPAVIVGGHHANLAATGALAELLVADLPQADEEGAPLGLFERTRILSFLGEMEFLPITEEGVPEGYQGTSGVRIFDPAVVSHRVRVWQ